MGLKDVNVPLGYPNWSGSHQEHHLGPAPNVTQTLEASSALDLDNILSWLKSENNNECLLSILIVSSITLWSLARVKQVSMAAADVSAEAERKSRAAIKLYRCNGQLGVVIYECPSSLGNDIYECSRGRLVVPIRVEPLLALHSESTNRKY